jgi:hypothetical protein
MTSSPHTGHLLPWGLTTPWGRIETSTSEVVSIGPDEVVFGRPLGESFADPHLRLALDVDEHLRVDATGSPETSVARRGRQVVVDAAAPHGLTVRFVPQLTTA